MIITGIDLDRILFEAVSAFGTVGLSTGITPDLPDAAKLVLIALMFLGRARAADPRLGDRAARSPHPLRIPEGEARHWLDSRSSAPTPRAASPRPTRSPSSGSAASAARSPSSSWPAAPRCSASTSTRTSCRALNGRLTQVVRADSTKEEALRQLAIDEFDRVVVAIGDDISASILTCSALLGMKIPVIWAKAVDDRHGLILEQLGVHHVIYPEKDMGRKVAHLVRGAAQDYIEIERGYAVVKSSPPSRLHGIPLGKTRAAQGVRRHHRGVQEAGRRVDERRRRHRARARGHHPHRRSDPEGRGVRAAALSDAGLATRLAPRTPSSRRRAPARAVGPGGCRHAASAP